MRTGIDTFPERLIDGLVHIYSLNAGLSISTGIDAGNRYGQPSISTSSCCSSWSSMGLPYQCQLTGECSTTWYGNWHWRHQSMEYNMQHEATISVEACCRTKQKEISVQRYFLIASKTWRYFRSGKVSANRNPETSLCADAFSWI